MTDSTPSRSGRTRSLIGLLGMTVLMGLGEHLGEKFLPLYLLALGATEPIIGLFQGLTNFLGAVYSYPGGLLADRIGPRRTLWVFNLATLTGYLIVILFPNLIMVFAGAALFLFWNAMAAPASMKMLADAISPHHRTKAVTALSLTRRIPKMAGPVLGGVLVTYWGEERGVRIAFGGALALTLITILIQQRLMGTGAADAMTKADLLPSSIMRDHPLALLRGMSPALRNLLMADILVRFCEQIPYAFVVIWCTTKLIAHPVSAWQFGVLTAIEMTTAMLLYIPVAIWADRSTKRPFVLMTFVFFTLFPAVLWYSHSFGWLAVAFVIRGFKEFGEPTRKALILDLCPADKRATYFGAYYLIRDVITSIAALGGGFLWSLSPGWNLGAAVVCGALGTLWFARFGQNAVPTPHHEGSS